MSGTAEPVAMELFDPCTVVPDEAIRAAGADPATKDDGGPLNSGQWKSCAWAGDSFFLDVQATTRTLDEFRSNPTYTELREVDVAGRTAAVSFRLAENADPSRSCVVAFDWKRGTIAILIDTKLTHAAETDPCVAALGSSNVLSSYLPT
ncbi:MULTISPECIES: DUF3558 domain-containing protein [unclassified Rhodococcus (in: high G+C Gram-positive bacteria)]|uniref:DUF3558 domain-containing protein n=1 Tax=unclassified Rhodococcus (in: high G+C Gram-positive bacteria) TaxID=192944 RepID=UPI000690BED7|nr:MULTISPECIES: DUF3558 domain-containing protein [unclassified Rhodococcus (in: high G+C Gram-positive bacteria)]MDQ1200589.1 hypothetical protein [Rhodococcus sp. SORGH_AS_0303]